MKFGNWVAAASIRHFIITTKHCDLNLAPPKCCAQGQMSPFAPLSLLLRRPCCPPMSNPLTSPWAARPDGSTWWDKRLHAQHLTRDLAQPSSRLKELAQTMKKYIMISSTASLIYYDLSTAYHCLDFILSAVALLTGSHAVFLTWLALGSLIFVNSGFDISNSLKIAFSVIDVTLTFLR